METSDCKPKRWNLSSVDLNQWRCQQNRDAHKRRNYLDLTWSSAALWYKEICTVLTVRSYFILCFDRLNPRWTGSRIWECVSFPAVLECCLLFTGPNRQQMEARWENIRPLLFCYDNQTESKTPRRCCFTWCASVRFICLSFCDNWNGDITPVKTLGWITRYSNDP